MRRHTYTYVHQDRHKNKKKLKATCGPAPFGVCKNNIYRFCVIHVVKDIFLVLLLMDHEMKFRVPPAVFSWCGTSFWPKASLRPTVSCRAGELMGPWQTPSKMHTGICCVKLIKNSSLLPTLLKIYIVLLTLPELQLIDDFSVSETSNMLLVRAQSLFPVLADIVFSVLRSGA